MMKPDGTHNDAPPLWLALLPAAMAGGMGWGIRGQYGHETGAMIAGVLVGLALVFLFCPRAGSLPAARAAAWFTVAISFGGSMTYGQTIGLTQDAPLIGNWEALRWGLLGLGVKGGIWIGFAGAFFGMALSGRQYRPLELCLLLLVMVFLLFLGVAVLNEPFDPARKLLPTIYFSDHWYWEPGADLLPRRERWGGLLFALAGLILYSGGIKRDRLARNLAFWGILAGGLGFPLGQCIQASHAWNPEWFRAGWFAKIEPHVNWWNMMETTFGAVFGGILALGLFLNRRHIAIGQKDASVELTPAAEWVLVAVHLSALAVWNFLSFHQFDAFADLALTMGIIPILAIATGRLWPYLTILPIVALPIAGKTLRQLGYEEGGVSLAVGWVVYVMLPLLVTTVAALVFANRAKQGQSGRAFTRGALLLTTWLYFGLNFAFFRFPWPWRPWTGRTPNGVIFTVCAIGLTVAALAYGRSTDEGLEPGQPPPPAGEPASEDGAA